MDEWSVGGGSLPLTPDRTRTKKSMFKRKRNAGQFQRAARPRTVADERPLIRRAPHARLLKKARAAHPDAMYELYVRTRDNTWLDKLFELAESFYYGGDAVDKNYATAIKWFTKCAENGHPDAMFYVAECFKFGCGVDQNSSTAAEWYAKCAETAENGLPHIYRGDAMYNLAIHYALGDGVDKNLATSRRFYTKAAKEGHTSAMFNLGLMYKNGEGVQKNSTKARKWFTKAADGGDAKAMYQIANYFHLARRANKNLATAVKWYTKVAEKGSIKVASYAMNNLGECFKEGGDGVEQNWATAVKWYKKAAEGGTRSPWGGTNYTSMYNLGSCYELGNGVQKNLREAWMWYKKAHNAQTTNPDPTAPKQDAHRHFARLEKAGALDPTFRSPRYVGSLSYLYSTSSSHISHTPCHFGQTSNWLDLKFLTLRWGNIDHAIRLPSRLRMRRRGEF